MPASISSNTIVVARLLVGGYPQSERDPEELAARCGRRDRGERQAAFARMSNRPHPRRSGRCLAPSSTRARPRRGRAQPAPRERRANGSPRPPLARSPPAIIRRRPRRSVPPSRRARAGRRRPRAPRAPPVRAGQRDEVGERRDPEGAALGRYARAGLDASAAGSASRSARKARSWDALSRGAGPRLRSPPWWPKLGPRSPLRAERALGPAARSAAAVSVAEVQGERLGRRGAAA